MFCCYHKLRRMSVCAFNPHACVKLHQDRLQGPRGVALTLHLQVGDAHAQLAQGWTLFTSLMAQSWGLVSMAPSVPWEAACLWAFAGLSCVFALHTLFPSGKTL